VSRDLLDVHHVDIVKHQVMVRGHGMQDMRIHLAQAHSHELHALRLQFVGFLDGHVLEVGLSISHQNSDLEGTFTGSTVWLEHFCAGKLQSTVNV